MSERKILYVAPEQFRVRRMEQGVVALHLDYLHEDVPWMPTDARVVLRLTTKEVRQIARLLEAVADDAET